MPLQYLKREFSYEIDVLHAGKHQSLLQVDYSFTSIIFDVFDQTCDKDPGKFDQTCDKDPGKFDQTCDKDPGKFAISLWQLKKEVTTEVRDLSALGGSNTALTIIIHLMFFHQWPISSLNT